MKLSIILPVYNAGPFLEKCLDSIVPELGEEVELIIVNDGSTDNSREIAEKYASSYDSIKVLCKKNSGQVETRNLGIRAATGEYICFIDADDWVEPGYYNKGLAVAVDKGADIVIRGYIYDTMNYVSVKNFNQYHGLYDSKQIHAQIIPFLAGIRYGNLINTSLWNKLFRRELLLDNIDLIHSDLRNGEDACLFIACISDARLLCITDTESYYHYVEHVNQISTRYDVNALYRTRRLYETLLNIGENKNLEIKLLKEMAFSQYWKVLSQISRLSNYTNNERLSMINEVLRDNYLKEVVIGSKNGNMPYEYLKKLMVRFKMGRLITKMCNK